MTRRYHLKALPTAFEVRRSQAHTLLDAAMQDAEVSEHAISNALQVTGDLPLYSKQRRGIEPTRRVKPAGTWKGRSIRSERAGVWDGLGKTVRCGAEE